MKTFMNKHLSALMRTVGALGWVIATSVHAQHTVPMTSNLPYASESQVRETLARPPHAKTVPSEGKPLTVLTGFLTRADGTALSQRGRDSSNVLDRSGKPVVDPAADPSANAFESDANLNWEKWDEYWRKVHGVRFTYADDPTDATLEALVRYDQLHRLPAGPTLANPPPYAAPADAHGKLYPGVIGHIPEYQRPRWDGIAYLNFRSPDDIGGVFGEKFQQKILPEDHVLFRQVAPVLSKQHIRIASRDGRDPIVLVYTHARRENLTREQFQDDWLNRHRRVVMAQPATRSLVSRYVQLQNIGGSEPGKAFYAEPTAHIDAITLMYFRSIHDVEDYLMSTDFGVIAKDLEQIASTDKSDYWTAIDYMIINRIGKEKITSSVSHK